jgi:hypothetical protein
MNLDPNMFAETFNFDEILRELKKIALEKQPSYNRTNPDQTSLVCDMIGKLFTAQYNVFNSDVEGCFTNDIDESLPKDFKHVNYGVHMLN